VETLKHTNEQLISTIDEVIKIQAEGKQKRAEAEKDLVNIENQLKEKMLEASKAN
ncbi:MAG: toxic anion resistance protein, partial [Lachnospiraceae bacterium]|nr:toxic anion resistance protein [Lachnospiraceae bacterium]